MKLHPTPDGPPDPTGADHPVVRRPVPAEPIIPSPRGEDDVVELVTGNITIRKRPARQGAVQPRPPKIAPTTAARPVAPVRARTGSPRHRRPEPSLTWMTIVDRVLGSWPRTRRAVVLVAVLGAALALLIGQWGAWGFGWAASLGAAFLTGAGTRG